MKHYNGVLKNENYIEIPKDELYDFYVIKKWSLVKIAKHYYVSHPTIINRLKEFDLYKKHKERENAKSI